MGTASPVRRLIAPPALAMLATALLALVMNAVLFVFGDPGQAIAEITDGIEEGLQGHYGPDYELDQGLVALFYWSYQAGVLLSCLAAAAGAALMLAQRAWWPGLIAALLMLTPFLWPCCCPLSAGVGVWALVILLRPDVQAVLRGRTPPEAPAAFTVPPPPPPESPREDGGWGSGT